MNVFVLEDSHDRIAWFREFLMGTNFIVATNVDEAKKEYPGAAWDLVFLDHDLHSSHYGLYMQDNDDRYKMAMDGVQVPTGFHFSRWLMTRNPVPTIIHTLNPAGQRAMNINLPWAIRIPFMHLAALPATVEQRERIHGLAVDNFVRRMSRRPTP